MIESVEKNEIGLLLELNRIGSFRTQFLKLVVGFDSLRELYGAKISRLRTVEELPSKSANLLAERLPKIEITDEAAGVEELGFEIITWFDESYPEQLRQLPQPPPVLYVRGDLSLDYDMSLSIVGSRSTSQYGISITNKLTYELSSAGFTIVSGGARGIDTYAHKSALDAGGKTIAVMACGLDSPYPPENKSLFEKIAGQGGVISEFPLGTIPEKHNFPARNRIIAALSRGTIVTEAGDRSGALITAGHALDLGRDIFAVPGRPTDMTSRGANKLIRDGAFLVLGVSDVIERFGMTYQRKKSGKGKTSLEALTDDERLVYEAIDLAPVIMDELSRKLEMNVNELMKPIVSLQLKGLIKEMPGKSFVRTVG